MTEQNNFGQYIGSHLDDDVTLSLPDLRQLPRALLHSAVAVHPSRE